MENKTFSGILIALITVVLMTGCGQNKKSREVAAEEPVQSEMVHLSPSSIKEIGLETETVVKSPFASFSTIPAKVLANQDHEALVGSLVQGRVCKVFVKAGDFVKAGALLMLVEGLEIGEIKAGFISAKANLAYQKANFERNKKLIDENVGSQKNLLETQN